ncbi:hypothetical protein KW786_01955 [Candidatus Parcubacteria bacterium]|nr:hypothetical protein [Candidatus Parcubacteria bacterium]
MVKKADLSSGKASSILLILAVMILVLIVGVFIFIKFGATKKTADQTSTTTEDQGPPPPVYETQVGNVKFMVESAEDLGKVIRSTTTSYQQNLTTTERFIKVIVGAQNKGKENTQQGAWDVGNIIDSEGRNFVSINNQAYFYLPSQNFCGAILKPEFEFTPCINLYEVSRQSTGLKVKVVAAGGGGSKGGEDLLDLLIK